MEDQLLMIYEVLCKILLKRGYLGHFNELIEKLPFEDPKILGEFFTFEWKFFSLTNLANNFNLLGKKAASNKIQT
jgi:hypothetical protein